MSPSIYLSFVILTFHGLLLSSSVYSQSNNAKSAEILTSPPKRPNLLIILADDLGYGDTSVPPFIGSGVRTPELKKMAGRGMIMTNFHTAAPTCTPTRASILTGLFPWRLGIKSVFEYGAKGKSNRDDWLALVPTLAMALRDANYSTGHSGIYVYNCIYITLRIHV